MKVLMIGRATLKSSPGGDTVQIMSTAKYLAKLNIDVDVKSSDSLIDYTQYDIIHFFNIIRPDDILCHINKAKLPYVVSTILVDYNEYEKNRGGRLGFLANLLDRDQMEYIKAVARFLKNGDKINSIDYVLRGHKKSIIKVAKKAGALLPNSHSEYNRFVESYGISPPYEKIPNAIDQNIFDFNVIANSDFKDHVLCVGRIEGRKNQLNLIRAMIGSDLKLTIIGKPSPNHLSYFEECKQIVSENANMQIIEHVDHITLAAIFKAAKVHVLPSWFETTGLSSLEAAIMDCNIVVTPKGDTTEYFGELAYYCMPDNIESIKDAVRLAYDSPLNPRLKELILDEYTWEKTASETLKAYNKILDIN